MNYIYRYQKVSDDYTTYRLQHSAGGDAEAPAELCELDGMTYVSMSPEVFAGLPAQPESVVLEGPLELTLDMSRRIIGASRYVRRRMETGGDIQALAELGFGHAAAELLLQQLYVNVKHFIEHLPSGWIRYDADLKMNIIGAAMNAMAQGKTMPKVCQEFNVWKAAVETEFLTLKALIESGDLNADVSVEMFEGKYGRAGGLVPDPGIGTVDLVGAA